MLDKIKFVGERWISDVELSIWLTDLDQFDKFVVFPSLFFEKSGEGDAVGTWFLNDILNLCETLKQKYRLLVLLKTKQFGAESFTCLIFQLCFALYLKKTSFVQTVLKLNDMVLFWSRIFIPPFWLEWSDS
jgi:hypothetical protein